MRCQKNAPSNCTRRLHALAPWFTLALDLVCEVFARDTAAFTLDSLPVPVCKRVRASRCTKVRGAQFYGYGAAKEEKFFGWRLHLVCTGAGVPVGFDLLPASLPGYPLGGMTVLNPPRSTAVLPCYPCRLHPLFEKARFVYHEHRLRIAQMRDHVLLQIVAHRIRVPLCRIQQALHAVGRALTKGFGQLPAVLTPAAPKQAVKVATGTGTHFGATKARGNPGVQGVKVGGKAGRT